MIRTFESKHGRTLVRNDKGGLTFFYDDNSYQANEQFEIIFELLLQGENIESIKDYLAKEYDIPEDADLDQDVRDVQSRCIDMGIDFKSNTSHSAEDEWEAPNFVDFNITNRCNMNCLHCYMGQSKPMDFPTGRAVRIIRELAQMGTLKVALAGGEPLLHPDWMELLNTIISSGMMAMINSNGTLINESIVKQLKERYEKHEIIFAISLDGADSRINSMQRPWADPDCKEDGFQKTLDAIDLLTSYGFTTCVNYTVTKLNIDSVLPLYNILQHRLENHWENFKVLNLLKFGIAGNGISNQERLDIDYNTWKQFLRNIADKKKNGELDKLKVEPTCPWELLIPLHGICSKEEIEKKWQYTSPLFSDVYSSKRNIGCNAGITHICINPDGCVSSCGLYAQLKEFHIGNVFEDNISNLWVTSKMLKDLRSIRLEALESECASCRFADSCGGGCRGAALSFTGSLLGPDIRCPISKSKASPVSAAI